MTVKGLGTVLEEKRRLRDGVSAKTKEVFESKLVTLFAGKELRSPDSKDFVSKSPEGIKPQGLMSRGVRKDIGVLSIRVGHIVVHRIVKDGCHKATRRNGAARVAGRGNVVKEDGTEGAINEIEGLKRSDFFL